MPALSVCEELDSLVVQYMSLVDEHLIVHNRISTKFQEVWFIKLPAHSYSLGKHAILNLFDFAGDLLSNRDEN